VTPSEDSLAGCLEGLKELEPAYLRSLKQALCFGCRRPMILWYGKNAWRCRRCPECRARNLEQAAHEGRVPSCDRCSRPMTLRYGKKGYRFWGCSGYPACRATKRVERPASGVMPEFEYKLRRSLGRRLKLP
jgi:ssDNA-binding Zn-finger/Zn-ribbon topoisomerase 1